MKIYEHALPLLKDLRKKPESYWIQRGQHMAYALYEEMKTRVPAYKAFLLQHHKNVHAKISQKTWDVIPLINKDTYLRKNSLSNLCWDGNLKGMQATISATSGSSGDPFYFPRTSEQDNQYARIAEMYLRTNFLIHRKSTLYIIGWGMGVWIGGVFSYTAVRIVAERGKYPLSVITPGTSKEEILKAVRTLGPMYDQVIIGGYPPMIKDLVDEGIRKGIKWKKYHVKFIFSAEGFSEAFRDYIARSTGLANIYLDTLNHYGTVDLGTMAHETPLSILIRRLARENKEINAQLFGDDFRQPTLGQYIPELFYFEQVNGSVVCSARSGLPLVRYDLLDTGGVLEFAYIRTTLIKCGIDLSHEIRKAKIDHTVWNIPFVYVFERNDFVVKWQGANIYPQEIRRALEHTVIEKFCTGRCTMQIMYDKNLNQSLVVHIELRKGKRKGLHTERTIQSQIIKELLQSNSEYAYLYNQLTPARMTPKVVFWGYQEPPHFFQGGKHTWTKK